MIRAKCPMCGSQTEGASLAELPWFPCCSERCKLVDLGRWLDGVYVIPGDVRQVEEETPPGPPPSAAQEEV